MLDIHNIIEKYGLDQNEVAKLLFPDNVRPNLALKRVAEKETLLNTEQFSRLASYIGVPMDSLMNKGWNSAKPPSANQLRFVSDDYEAILNKETFQTRIFHKGSLLHEEIIVSATTPISIYLDALNEIIKTK